MRSSKLKLTLLLALTALVSLSWGIVDTYTFVSSSIPYQTLTGGINLGTAANDEDVFNNIPLGFTFNFDATNYTAISIASNGFLAMGPTVVTSDAAIGSGTSNDVIAPFSMDLVSRANGSLSYGFTGLAPYRIFTIQWHNYRRAGANAANDSLNFQIKLHETSNLVTYCYGHSALASPAGTSLVQVGLRGASVADFATRVTTSDWTNTIAGTMAVNGCQVSSTVYPPSGLTFYWSPAAYPSPYNLTAMGTAAGIVLSWNAPLPLLPNLTGYRIYRDGVNITPSPIAVTTYVDGNIMNGTPYTYYVVAVYTSPNGTSEPSNSVTATGGEVLNPITNLDYSVALDDVSLTWLPPGGPIYQDWIHYDDGANANNIGTGGAVDFDIAIRFTQTELSAITDRYLTKVRFYPAEAACSYSIKIWTGGSAWNIPGTLAQTVPVTNPTINAWNIVDLPAPIQIPSTGELWVGVNCNATTGYPAGADNGPSQPYKANLIYINGAWTILTLLDQTLDFNWNIQAFVTNFIGRDRIPQPIPDRNMFGYRVYRNDVPIADINNILVSNYTDSNLENGTYSYFVTALYTTGESLPSQTVNAVVSVVTVPIVLQDSFENFADFTTDLGIWRNTDLDLSPTQDVPEFEFPGEGNPMAYIVFNPSATTPPLVGVPAHTGNKFLACFPATTPPNNDWLMSPRIRLGTENSITFWARSIGDSLNLARFKCGVSTAANPIPATFTWLSGPNSIEPTTTWTQYSYPVPSAYNAQRVFYGIKCESDGGSTLLIDDIKIQGYSALPNGDDVLPVVETALLGNYPNPFNPETVITYSLKSDAPVTLEVYNLKGQKVRTLVNENLKGGNFTVTWKGDDEQGNKVAAGVYLYKMSSGKFTSSRKMILLK
jgi:hypothetical protein